MGGSVSQGLEFAYNDWLIAQLMKQNGRKDLYDRYMALSRNYHNYFDPETKLMRGRMSDGRLDHAIRPRVRAEAQ